MLLLPTTGCMVALSVLSVSTAGFSPVQTISDATGLPRSSTTSVSMSAPTSTVLYATVEQKSQTKQKATRSKQLVPPSSIEDVTANAQSLYDSNVQKTYGRYPLTMKSGKGCKLFTADGREFLDCVSGIATCALGHSNDVLSKAVADQMQKAHHVSNLYLIPSQAGLAKWLCDNSVAQKVFFCNSGAEANEAAIKLARRHAYNRGIDKPVIITAEQSFHGRTLAALSATAQPKYHKGFSYDGSMVPGFEYTPYNNVEALQAKVQEIKDSGRGLAAIMMEALQGEGGIIPGKLEFFSKIRSICDQTGALMICDEVQIGMGRSGMLWGYQNLGIEPDIFTSAKALGGGVPIGAMMAGPKVADVFGPGDHASTYGGNPLACAAGMAVAKYLSDYNVLENVVARGEQLEMGLKSIAAKYPKLLGDVRGWGLLRGVEVVDDHILPGKIVSVAMDLGLLLVSAGKNVVRFVPPLIISNIEIHEALTMFENAVAKVAADEGPMSP